MTGFLLKQTEADLLITSHARSNPQASVLQYMIIIARNHQEDFRRVNLRNMTASVANEATFLGLPPELRLEIYTMMSRDDGRTVRCNSFVVLSTENACTAGFAALSRTCRKVHIEVEDML